MFCVFCKFCIFMNIPGEKFYDKTGYGKDCCEGGIGNYFKNMAGKECHPDKADLSANE